MENLQGTLLKDYQLEERIGSGGFGAVYRARQSTIGREVAIKIILPGFANNPDFIRRFEAEAHLVARLEHPYITPLHDFWRDPDGAYLVMRYLRGGSLRHSLQSGPYELHAASQLLDQIAFALDFAHRNDVIHRDIKPGNILLDEDGNAYLADFGIAKDLTGITDNKTAVDAVMGSLDYISPEQARSEPVTPCTDIYSLGVTLYEMVTGEHPFQNASTIERLYKHINDPLPEITTLPDEVRDTINAIIQKATAKDPALRYPDVLALALAFQEGIGRGTTQQSAGIVEQLTMREQEVLSMVAKGMNNREIAELLVVTMSTVKWHITQLYKKLGVRSRVQAMVRARELNLIVSGDTSDDLPAVNGSLTAISLPEPENPYKGLHAFQMTDARDFFGRDDLTKKLLDRLCDETPYHRFLAVVGPSGSGKSSLVKAGLIPALWRGAIPGSDKWFVVDMIPGSHPLDKLETALIRVAANQSGSLREQLQRDERGLLRVADIILPGDDTELVIVVDQFEEAFTLVEQEEDRQRFLDLLRVAVSEVRSRVRVVVTLRADYYDRPLHYPEFGELIHSQMETVLPLTAKGLERAVRGPAERVGMVFEQGLVEQIISAMNYQAGALPLLQYALTELFDRREGRLLTNEAYQRIGGAVGALANRADEIYSSLTEEAQELAHQMFMRLVTLGEGAEDTRRRAMQAELLSLTDNTDLMEEIIDQFVAYRLLSLDHDPETRQPTVEVAHEAILREWDRLRQWLNESRDDIRQEQALARAAQEWKQHNQDISYLLRGARLEQIETWHQTTDLALTPLEQSYIAESLQQRETETQAEIARQKREVHLERRSRSFLRGLVAVFAIATITSAVLSLFALESDRQSRQSAAEFRSVALSFGAKDALDSGQPDVALALAREALRMENSPPSARSTFIHVSGATWIKQRLLVSNTSSSGTSYFPDGQRVVTTDWGGWVKVWDIPTGEVLQSIQREERLTRVALHPHSGLIAVNGDDELFIWNPDTDEVIQLLDISALSGGLAFSQEGNRLFAARSGEVMVWDTATWERMQSWEAHDANTGIPGMHLSPDETLLITSSFDTTAKVWDIATGELLNTFDLNTVTSRPEIPPWVWDAQMTSDGETVLIGGGFEIVLWNWRIDEIVWVVSMPTLVQDISISPDEQMFVVGYEQIPAQIRDMETGALIRSFDIGQRSRTRFVDFSPDGQYVLSSNNDGTVVIWPVHWEGTLASHLVDHAAQTLAWHPHLPLVGVLPDRAGSETPVIQLVDMETGEVVQELTSEAEHLMNLVFTSDGRRLLVSEQSPLHGSEDQRVFVIDVETSETILVLGGHDGWTSALALSPDDRIVAVGESSGRRIHLWNLEVGERLAVLEGHQNWVMRLYFSPDGRYLYSAGNDGALFKWDVETGEQLLTFIGVSDYISNVHVNPDGTLLIATSDDSIARIWDTETGQLIHILQGHTKGLISAEFSPTEPIVLTSSGDGTLGFWDVETGQRYFTYAAFADDVWPPARFSPDGSQVVTGGNGMLLLLATPPRTLDLEWWIVDNRYIPDFTCEQRELYEIEPLCENES